mmetsp:Transcript_28140/g.47327  ORF Transcript_28140/g.47327 Transcript_28140/m.47327 type:complete len:148 (+) Transcript_28140:52-495(+)
MNSLIIVFALVMLAASVSAFRSISKRPSFMARNMITITDGVEFDTIAREWRLKWSGDDDKKSLASVQQTLNLFTGALKGVDGVKSVQRVVCGGCLDYKVVVALPADKFGDWEAKEFAPEAEFLAAVKAINGVSQVETQTYTLMPVDL